MDMRMNRNLMNAAAILAGTVFIVSLSLSASAKCDYPVEIDEMRFMLDDSDMTATVWESVRDDWGDQELYSGDVVIPPYVEYEGCSYKVTSIGPRAFVQTYADSLHLPETVVGACDDSFSNMFDLRTVTVDEANPSFMSKGGVLYSKDEKVLWLFPRKWVKEHLMSGNPLEYTIHEGVEEIKTSFLDTGIERLNLPNTLKKAGNNAFDCATLKEIELPESLEYLGDRCLQRTTIESELRIPESVTHIGDDCFALSLFTSITLPKNLTCINAGMFKVCRNLRFLEIPEGVTKIGVEAFSGTAIEVSLPESLVSLDKEAFAGIMTSTLRLPDGVRILPNDLFNQSTVANVTIGNDVERIGSIFSKCYDIADIYSPCETPPDIDGANPLGLNNYSSGDDMRGKVNVHVRPGCAQAYLDSPWKLVGPIIEDLPVGVDEIGDDMTIRDDELCEAYSLSGATVASRLRFGEVGDALPKGLYIIRTANGKSAKIVVR